MRISRTIINWYTEKKRDLPWRNTENPYYVWVSEVILQQTRIAQGLDYYKRFIAKFTDIQSLANADINEVLKIWQGLGYYSRARNLHAGAKYVIQQLQGKLPANYNGLLKIQGVGEYTAAAIGSIAFNLPVAAVDGNVNRVIARIYGIHDAVNSPQGVKQIKEIAQNILDVQNPGLHNQAIMEFGALQCVVRNPNCIICPLNKDCYAYLHGEVGLLPVKIKQQKGRNRYFNYLVILFNNGILLSQRKGKDIWQGLYEFPLIETVKPINVNKLMVQPEWNHILKESDYQLINISKTFKHQLTHQKIHARFFLIAMKNRPEHLKNSVMEIRREDLSQFPVSKLIENYLSTIDREIY